MSREKKKKKKKNHPNPERHPLLQLKQKQGVSGYAISGSEYAESKKQKIIIVAQNHAIFPGFPKMKVPLDQKSDKETPNSANKCFALANGVNPHAGAAQKKGIMHDHQKFENSIAKAKKPRETAQMSRDQRCPWPTALCAPSELRDRNFRILCCDTGPLCVDSTHSGAGGNCKPQQGLKDCAG